MCLFNYANLNTDGKAYKHGITKFECGSCPECLQKKSRNWALRACMEAKNNIGMMITLTYDTYKYENSHIENPVDTSLHVSIQHLQRFFKRLRYYFPDNEIKYIGAGEYGKRTHRAHYHAVIFGLHFDDLRAYKKSKRGNMIYKSKTLEKIWKADKQHNGGICTVDSININASVARYCTKYCAKDSGVEDTFMLFSRGIGEDELLKRFNGKSYVVEGREYPIPRQIWYKYIERKYGLEGYSRYMNLPNEQKRLEKASSFFKYVNYDIKKCHKYIKKNCYDSLFKRWLRSMEKREFLQNTRDNDSVYKNYVSYWSRKARLYEKYQAKPFDRIRALPDDKYRSYKVKALQAFNKGKQNQSYIPPRSNCHAIQLRHWKEIGLISKGGVFLGEFGVLRSRHYTPNDRNLKVINGKLVYLRSLTPQEEREVDKICPFK